MIHLQWNLDLTNLPDRFNDIEIEKTIALKGHCHGVTCTDSLGRRVDK